VTRPAPARRVGAGRDTATTPPDESVTRAVGGLFGRDSVYMLVWALQMFVAAAMTPLITRVMAASEFGAVASAIAVMQVLFGIAGLGLQTAIQRYFAERGPADARRLLMLSLVLAVAVTVVADATGPLWSGLLGFDSYPTTLRLAVFWAGASAVTNAALGLLRSQDRLLMFGCVGIVQSVVAEAMSLTLVVAVRPTALMFVLGRLLAQLAAVAVALLATRPMAFGMRYRRLAVTGLAYALPLVPAELSTFVLNIADRLIVRHQLGLAEVARYHIAFNLGVVPTLLITILNVAWLPRIFALTPGDERAAVLATSRDALYRLLMPVMIGLSLGMPILLRLWAPADYRPDSLLLVAACVIVSVVPYTAALSTIRGLLASGHTGTVAVATAVAAAVNVGLNLLLLPHFGLAGSAAATFAAYLVQHGILLTRSRVVAPVRGPGPARLGRVTLAVLATLLAGVLPTSPGLLVLRGVLVVATVVWFARILMQLSTLSLRRTHRG
jgi:O-antigen/teichoic acid export membrane protein